MADVMRKIDALARRAREESLPSPLSAAAVFGRINAASADVVEEPVFSFNAFAGVGAFAAAAAVVIIVMASSAWVELNDPLSNLQSLMDVLS